MLRFDYTFSSLFFWKINFERISMCCYPPLKQKQKINENPKIFLWSKQHMPFTLPYYCYYYFYQLLTTQLFSINLSFSNHFPCHPIKMSTPVNNLCVLREKYAIQSHWDYISLVRIVYVCVYKINKKITLKTQLIWELIFICVFQHEHKIKLFIFEKCFENFFFFEEVFIRFDRFLRQPKISAIDLL